MNEGDSTGVLNHTWGIDLLENKGHVTVSNPLKNVFDEVDDTSFQNPAGAFVEYSDKIWAISNNVYKTVSSTGDDITLTANWSKDTTGSTPSPGATVTDAVVFNNKLLVQDGTDIFAYNGSTWSSWWKGTLAQASLSTGYKFILKVGPDTNLYIVDGSNKVYRVKSSTLAVTKTGAGTLDFSATRHRFICSTITSSRIFFGSEDKSGENSVIVEWDMGPQSITANRIHNMGTKRVIVLATWDDTPIAILSDGSIKYHNGSSFVNWKGAHLPKTKDLYQSDIIHKNGWAIIDDLPHFLINPTVDINEDVITEDTSNYWNFPAGIYCLDPERGLTCRYALTDGVTQQRNIASVGALFARGHKNTKFLASYDFYTNTPTAKSVIACEDKNNSTDSIAWLGLQPIVSYDNIIKKIDLLRKRLGTGDSIDVFVRRFDVDSVRIEGNWITTSGLNTTDDVSAIGDDWFAFSRTYDSFASTVASIVNTGTVSTITFKDANSNTTLNANAIVEFVNFKKIATINNTTLEWDSITLTDTTKSRHVWVLLKLNQSAGNKIELDYVITGT